jgi:hypothetical protein
MSERSTIVGSGATAGTRVIVLSCVAAMAMEAPGAKRDLRQSESLGFT